MTKTTKNFVYVVSVTKFNDYSADTVMEMKAFTDRDKAVDFLTVEGFTKMSSSESEFVKDNNFDISATLYLLEVK